MRLCSCIIQLSLSQGVSGDHGAPGPGHYMAMLSGQEIDIIDIKGI